MTNVRAAEVRPAGIAIVAVVSGRYSSACSNDRVTGSSDAGACVTVTRNSGSPRVGAADGYTAPTDTVGTDFTFWLMSSTPASLPARSCTGFDAGTV